MHSTIYEIRESCISPEEWAYESAIADGAGKIAGVDYYGRINDERKRCERIADFFLGCFPDKSFELVKNEPGETAIVKFVGDIEALYDKWIAEVKENAALLSRENISDLGLYYVRAACTQPFGLSSKFYLPGWTGRTGDADNFLLYLRHLNKENNGRPFFLYIGQVFDYHF